jgi:DNA polymerase-3 subunit beta
LFFPQNVKKSDENLSRRWVIFANIQIGKQMKFIVSSSALLKQLQQINGVIGSNNVLPILEDFLFEIDNNKLTVVATDLETVMKIHLDIEAKDNGRVCIPAKILMDSLKNLPNQPLTFDIDKNFGIEITSDNGKYKVMGENPDNFPKEPPADDTSAFTMTSHQLLTAINKSIFAVSNDDLRPAMTGVFFELETTGLTVVATDAHRLVRYRLKEVNCPKTDNFIVPKKPLNLLKSSLPDNEDEISVSYNSNHMFVTHGTVELSCRLLDARFPDYKVVIPAENPYRMTIGRQDFQSALRRVSIFSNKSTNLVTLNISGSALHLMAQDIVISFNARFLIEMLGSTSSDEVRLELSTPTKAGLIKPVEQDENEDLLMLAMPLMSN